MPPLKDVRSKWKEKLGQKQTITPYRYAYLGDGRGFAASNMYVPGDGGSNLLYARDTPDASRFYPVLNRNAVVPKFNLPIVIGYKQDEPRTEQILSIHTGGLGNVAGSNVPVLGPHHQQHEFGGGDEVFVDGLLFKPGLVIPTTPASMQLTVLPFVYFWDTWRRYGGGTTDTFTRFKPTSGYVVYVLVALDPTTNTLVYRPGAPILSPGPPYNVNTFSFSNVPPPAGNEFPLAYILINAGATSLNWAAFQNVVGDGRLHVNPPMLNVLDRLRQLEGYSGNEPSIATTGAGASTVDDVNHSVEGLTNVAITSIADQQALVWSQPQNKWVNGTATGGGGASQSNATPTNISASGQAGNSASAARGDHVHSGISNATPINIAGSAQAGTSASVSKDDHIHKGTLAVVGGTGTSVSNDGVGNYTVSMAGSGWASAIQTGSRAFEVVYTNGSLTRMVNVSVGMKPSVTVSNDISLRADSASPPTVEIARIGAVSGLGASVVDEISGMITPGDKYWLRNLTAAGPITEIVRWIEYDDYGGAPAPAIVNRVFNGRLTVDGSNSIPSSDVTSASAVWYVPHIGNQVSLYSSASIWNTITFNPASLVLTGLSPNSNYDIWGYQNVSELSLLATRWNPNDTARVNSLSAQDGIQTEASNRTRVLLGTIRITGTSAQSEDSLSKRFVWNTYNRTLRHLLRAEPTGSWTYNSNILRQADNSSANFVAAVIGLAEYPTHIEVRAQGTNNSGAAAFGSVGIGITSTTVNSADLNHEFGFNSTTVTRAPMIAKLDHLAIGYYSYNWLESARSGSMTFDGTQAGQHDIMGMYGLSFA